MNESVKVFKNAQHIDIPDWKFCWEYGIRPGVSIGENCIIAFQPVKGWYFDKAYETKKEDDNA